MDPVLFILILLALFEVKHLLCDGPLQTAAMVSAKGTYGSSQGLVHAGVHGLFTVVLLLAWGASLWPALWVSIAEVVVHYHIDFAKEKTGRRLALKPSDRGFWWLLGVDQALHRFTYLAIAAYFGLAQD